MIKFLLSLRVHCPSIFRSITIKLNVPHDKFSSIPIEPTVSVPWDAALKQPVQSSLISVTSGTRIFKCNNISLHLHNWAVLRLCIVFSIGESLRVCSKFSHWYYLLLIWGGAKVSSIAIELLLQDQKRKILQIFFVVVLCSRRTALTHKII